MAGPHLTDCGPTARPLQGRARQSVPSIRQLAHRPMQAFLYNMVLLSLLPPHPTHTRTILGMGSLKKP